MKKFEITVTFLEDSKMNSAVVEIESGTLLYPSVNAIWVIAKNELIKLGHKHVAIKSIFLGNLKK